MNKDVTSEVSFGSVDDESLPLGKCVCGKRFRLWDHILGIYPDMANRCPECGRKLYFSVEVHVYEVNGDEG